MRDNFIFSIGLMSGTSLDGLDVVYVKFGKNTYHDFEIIACETYAYSEEWTRKLRNGIRFSKEELSLLNEEYGLLLGRYVNRFIQDNAISRIDFIASHGHTIFHKPHEGITLQIGDGQILANETQSKVVCDFRTQDVLLGGQGAPLVPIGDELLFSEYTACLNLGGFANISYKEDNNRIAFDICPVNIVLNHYSNKMGIEFDAEGSIAASGKINHRLLSDLNALKFYRLPKPKSLGFEWVLEFIFPLIDSYEIKNEDILRTFVEHIAIQISNVIKRISPVLITGGGVFNSFLINRVSYHAHNEIVIPDEKIINYKEALIFSLLGILKIAGKVNCLKSVTGAKKNHSSGVIFNPNNS
jgi:anhydro-N-acetylmuramic acid kinase